MKKYLYSPFLLFLIVVTSLMVSCSDEDDELTALSAYDQSVITYFKSIALGFEFGDASPITRKWNNTMKIFVGGTPSADLRTELDAIVVSLNDLFTDGFSIRLVNDSAQSNYYIFFGSGDDYAKIFPHLSDLITSNWGLFSVFWDAQSNLQTGYMYVDLVRANLTEQKHLLREELTQSLGLARDSDLYIDSIFQSSWTTTTEYADIDRDLIRLLYHPDITSGMNAKEVETALIRILLPS